MLAERGYRRPAILGFAVKSNRAVDGPERPAVAVIDVDEPARGRRLMVGNDLGELLGGSPPDVLIVKPGRGC